MTKHKCTYGKYDYIARFGHNLSGQPGVLLSGRNLCLKDSNVYVEGNMWFPCPSAMMLWLKDNHFGRKPSRVRWANYSRTYFLRHCEELEAMAV